MQTRAAARLRPRTVRVETEMPLPGWPLGRGQAPYGLRSLHLERTCRGGYDPTRESSHCHVVCFFVCQAACLSVFVPSR